MGWIMSREVGAWMSCSLALCRPHPKAPFWLGPPVVPFSPLFLGEGSSTKIDYRKKGTLILESLLEDLVALTRLALISEESTCWSSHVSRDLWSTPTAIMFFSVAQSELTF